MHIQSVKQLRLEKQFSYKLFINMYYNTKVKEIAYIIYRLRNVF